MLFNFVTMECLCHVEESIKNCLIYVYECQTKYWSKKRESIVTKFNDIVPDIFYFL